MVTCCCKLGLVLVGEICSLGSLLPFLLGFLTLLPSLFVALSVGVRGGCCQRDFVGGDGVYPAQEAEVLHWTYRKPWRQM